MGSSPSVPTYRLFVGVDIAATSFTALWTMDIRTLPRAVSFSQTPAGFAAFQQQLHASGVAPAQTLIVLEATGSYWVALAVALHAAGYAVAVLNPAQLHSYAQSLPRRGKTDALDTQVFVRFAAERQPAPWIPPPAVYHELRQRLVARDGLVAMRQQARNQRHALAQWPVVVASVLTQLDGVIADLDQRLASLEDEIAAVLADGAWATSAALLTTIPGIGLVTAAWLLVSTLNFSLCATPEQATAYAGLVPLQREYGTSVRGRAQLGHGGNSRLRTALYLATLSATRYNPPIKVFYERLRSAGKPMKVARCAAARKLLHVAWAMVTKGQPFDTGHAQVGGTRAAALALAA
ncbi:MAG TPA: IS110 family transposase [Herpetosiphonaceae bacterium]|nr:IS110 family transposase [Herpetosiphonaceae bacterium]